MPFGQTLKRIRREKRVKQSDLAGLIDMDPGYLSRIENDKLGYNPSRETVEKIVEKLNCTDAERAELLGEAGRIGSDVEQAARLTNERPELRELFNTAVWLSPERVQELVEMAKSRMEEQNDSKSGGE